MARRLTNLRIDEVSSVDRGAGKGVRVLLMKRHAQPDLYLSTGDVPADALTYLKREFSTEERQSAADRGQALPDGCLSGDTLVETPSGQRRIDSLLGPCTVLTDYGWRAAEVRCFGEQRLLEIVVRRGNHRHAFLATAGHRWYTRRGVALTNELTVGDAIPHVSRNCFETEGFEPAEHSIAAVAEQAAHGAGGVAVVDMECRPFATGNGMLSARDRHATTERASATLIGAHSVELALVNTVFSTEHAVSSHQPPSVAHLNCSGDGGRLGDSAEPAFRPVTLAASIELGDRFTLATDAASKRDHRPGDWGNCATSHIPHISRDWLVEEVNTTDLVEPVFCAIVPELHRFVLAGGVLTGNSFPIKDKQDLKNAIQAIGRAKDPAKAKAHIKTRARALGASDMLPDSWEKRDEGVAEKALLLAVGSILSEGGGAGDVVECFKQFHEFLGDQQETDMTKEEIAKLVAETATAAVTKALEDAGVSLKKMTKEHAAYHANLDGDEAKKFSAMGHDERVKYMKDHPVSGGDGEEEGESAADDEETEKVLAKVLGADVAKSMMAVAKAAAKKKPDPKDEATKRYEAEIKKRDTENETLKKRLAALEGDKQLAEFKKRATDIGLPEGDGELLLKAHRGDPEALTKIEDKIKALHTQVEKAGLFSEIGSAGGAAATAHDELVAKAQEIRKADKTGKMTVEQAYVKAMDDNPELAKREKAERDQRINKLAA